MPQLRDATEPHYECADYGQGLIKFSKVDNGKRTGLRSGMFPFLIDCQNHARFNGFCVEESCREVVFENPRETIRVTRWFQKERTPT